MNLIRFNQYPIFNELIENLGKSILNEETETTEGNIPAVNVLEENDKYILELAAPGLKKSDFKINLDNQMLTIYSEKKEEKQKNKKNYSRHEFSYHSFSRSFSLPDDIEEDKITAKYENGILTVELPKKEPELKVNKIIEIK